METKLVIISGKQGAGKTTIGEELIHQAHKRMGYDCENLTFASTIYEMHDSLRTILKNRNIEIPEAVKVKDGPLLQWLGTEWGRNTIGEDVWVDCLRGQIENVTALHKGRGDKKLLIVVTDCRFKNEFDGFPEALRVRLHCSKPTRQERCSMWRDNDSHPSETDLDDYQAEGKFDLIVYSDAVNVTGCVDLIGAQLQKGSWMEKR